MNPTQQAIGFGVPGSFPLPISGQPGTSVARNLKDHPAAVAARPIARQAPGTAVPGIRGRK